MSEQRLFTAYEQFLFSKVVALAEKAGKHVDLLVVPSSEIFPRSLKRRLNSTPP